MAKNLDILEAVRNKGYRLTPQRTLILSIIAGSREHMGVDRIFRQAQRSYPYLDLATVYRTVRLFKTLGIVTELSIGDKQHYELADPTGAHHHMVCRICGSASDLSPIYLEVFRASLIDKFGFQPDLEHFTIGGVCEGCHSISQSHSVASENRTCSG